MRTYWTLQRHVEEVGRAEKNSGLRQYWRLRSRDCHLKAFMRHVNLYQTQVVRQITFLWHLWLIKPFIPSLNILTTPVMYQICVGTLGIWEREDVIWLLRVYSQEERHVHTWTLKYDVKLTCGTLGGQKMITGPALGWQKMLIIINNWHQTNS